MMHKPTYLILKLIFYENNGEGWSNSTLFSNKGTSTVPYFISKSNYLKNHVINQLLHKAKHVNGSIFQTRTSSSIINIFRKKK